MPKDRFRYCTTALLHSDPPHRLASAWHHAYAVNPEAAERQRSLSEKLLDPTFL
jgi:hypothetical protein